MTRIVKFPVPKSTHLLNYIEEHVASPSSGRLLMLFGGDLPKEPRENPQGMLVWDRNQNTFQMVKDPVELSYEIAPMPMPEWFTSNLKAQLPGHWFTLTLFRDGSTFSEIKLRHYSRYFAVQVFCPKCNSRGRTPCSRSAGGKVYIDELSGETFCDLNVPGCPDYLGIHRTHTVLRVRERPAKRSVKPRSARALCAQCGLPDNAPIHKLHVEGEDWRGTHPFKGCS